MCSPHSLRIAEVKSWKRPWVDDAQTQLDSLVDEIMLEDKPSRPALKLKLDSMPSAQEAEARAQRAANRLIARVEGNENGLKLSLSSESDANSDSERQNGSRWSPHRGQLTTPNVSGSEAGIRSPDSDFLNLQHDLVRIRQVGKGSSGTVYKAIHVPTLNIVAVKVREAGKDFTP